VLEKEYEAARQVGLDVVWAEAAPIPSAPGGRCLLFRNQARFHPLKYLNGLIRCLERDGAELHSGTTVTDVAEQEDGTVLVRTASGPVVRARSCVVTTNSPFHEVQIHFKQAPYRTYALAGRVPRGAVEDALFWDTLDSYHYVRLQPTDDGASDWLMTENERTIFVGKPTNQQAALYEAARAANEAGSAAAVAGNPVAGIDAAA
jgi:glycine/D-amino acid oxidase-like deaminating enzyme